MLGSGTWAAGGGRAGAGRGADNWWLRGHYNGDGRGGSDDAGRKQGRALLGFTAAVAQVGQGKKR